MKRVAISAIAISVLALTACGQGTQPAADPSASPATTTDAQSTQDASAFPVTIKHAYGETVISNLPERVATVAWANQEVPLALGIVPVGMPKITWGDDDTDGLMPWVKEKLDELGAETPVLFDETDGIDFEAVADSDPDVILAAYSGLTQEEYDRLSDIAPVVAFPELAWGTSYQDMIRINAKAIGLEAAGDKLVADLEKESKDALAAFPELAGKTVAFAWVDPSDLSQVGVYTNIDPRPRFLYDLGLKAPSVLDLPEANSGSFFYNVSAENADVLADVDFFVTYEALKDQMQSDPLLSKIPAIAQGRIVDLGSGPLGASANPSPLSISWGISDYFEKLASVLK